MELFSKTGATGVDDPEYGHFEPGGDGMFVFPDDLGERLHRQAVRGVKQWETRVEKAQREAAEDLARRRDPAYLAELVSGLLDAQRGTEHPPPADDPDTGKAKAPARPKAKAAAK
jgi:hypothetical protein